jgi:hypothetical protein
MYKLNLLIVLLLSTQLCFGQSNITTATTKTMTMTFEGYEAGDYPHLSFKDSKTNEDYDFRHLSYNNYCGINFLLDDAENSFGLKANPRYLNKTFRVVANYKTVMDNDLEGKTIYIKDWVIASVKEIKSTVSYTSNYYTINSQRAYFYNTADYKSRRKAYLVYGEVIYPLARLNGFVYIEYTNANNIVTKGWISAYDLR